MLLSIRFEIAHIVDLYPWYLQVKPDENVALVVLLCIIISLSVVEISGENQLQPQKQVHVIGKGRPSGIEWGR